MILKEERRDLFTVPKDYYLAHCISADFGMGKGIVIEFNKQFDMKNKLKANYQTNNWNGRGYCIRVGRVFNLITKQFYYDKPTYQTLQDSLVDMREQMIVNNIQKVAMPVIGCGLDKLKWDKVKALIEESFADLDIEVLVCIK